MDNTKIGLNKKDLYVMKDFYDSTIDGYIDRYKDFIKEPAPLQEQFAKDMFEIVATDIDTSNITVLSARCGVGKSTFVSSLISYFCTYDNYAYRQSEAVGAIVVTDKLDRLVEYQDKPQHIQSFWGEENEDVNIKKYSTYISSNDDKSAMSLLIESQYKPIVLLSTQRYFSMSDEQREMLFEYYYVDWNKNKTKMTREIIIFDEKPYFSNTLRLEVKNLNDCSTALQNGIPECPQNRENKDWLLQEYRRYRDKMENLLREKEKTNSNVDRFYWKDKNTNNLTSNDDRFFELIEKNKSTIAKEYPNVMTDLRAFKTIMTEGAFFTTTKKSRNQEYRTFFELYQDNKSKFYLGQNKVKCFVFDATADIDPDYKLDYVKIIDCSKYNTPINLTINFLNVASSKSQLVNSSNSESQIKAIYKTIKEYCYQKGFGNTLIVTYKPIEEKFKGSDFMINHFGGIKGMNEFLECSKFAHVGNNRFDPFVYFIKYISQKPELLKMLKGMDELTSREYIKNSVKMTKGLFENSVLNNIMFKSILADFEQNIFRTAIRNYNNGKEVNVYTFWNCDTFNELNNMIESRLSPYGVNFEYLGVPDQVNRVKTENRKTKNGIKTNPQKIFEWIETKKNNNVELFKISDMLDETKLTRKQYEKAIEHNYSVRMFFNNNKTNKKGWYKIS